MVPDQREIMLDENVAQFLVGTIGNKLFPNFGDVDSVFLRLFDCLSGNHKIILHNDSLVGLGRKDVRSYAKIRVLRNKPFRKREQVIFQPYSFFRKVQSLKLKTSSIIIIG